jgi:hypothetical protein
MGCARTASWVEDFYIFYVSPSKIKAAAALDFAKSILHAHARLPKSKNNVAVCNLTETELLALKASLAHELQLLDS